MHRILAGALALLVAVASPLAAGTKVRIATPVGNIDLELYDEERPITVQNFLKYINSGRYAGSFAHRLIPGFVIQGGGFCFDGTGYSVVESYGPIKNEYGNQPTRSNVKGTITMAKLGGNPDSATSQWFINLKDNNTGPAADGNLDIQNGGFTVFGRVTSGLNVLEIFNTGFGNGLAGGRGVYNASTYEYFGSVQNPNPNFTHLPLLSGADVEAGLIFTTITILPDPIAPVVKIKGGARIKTKAASVRISGTASSSVTTLEWRLGTKGGYRKQAARASWKLRVNRLKWGTNVLSLRGATAANEHSAVKKITIIRRK